MHWTSRSSMPQLCLPLHHTDRLPPLFPHRTFLLLSLNLVRVCLFGDGAFSTEWYVPIYHSPNLLKLLSSFIVLSIAIFILTSLFFIVLSVNSHCFDILVAIETFHLWTIDLTMSESSSHRWCLLNWSYALHTTTQYVMRLLGCVSSSNRLPSARLSFVSIAFKKYRTLSPSRNIWSV